MALPQILGLKSNYNNKYVQYVKEDAKTHGHLQCLGENLVTPYTKYQIEIAKNGDGLVHIKCCYNNKYLVRLLQQSYWLIAGSDEPVEDRSSWLCTLFQPIPLDSKTIRFRHVQLGHYACLWRTSDVFDFGLFAGSKAEDKDQRDVFTIIDWESLCLFPRNTYVAFKGDNGAYLGVRQIEGNPYLQFSSTNVESTEKYEVFNVRVGRIRIKSLDTPKFWKCNSAQHGWILVDSDDPFSDNSDTIFFPSKVRNNVIALRNLGSNKFCKRFTVDNTFQNLLSANSDFISPEAQLEVVVLSTSRNIYNVNYHLKDARIYHRSVDLLLASGSVVNRTKEHYTFV